MMGIFPPFSLFICRLSMYDRKELVYQTYRILIKLLPTK